MMFLCRGFICEQQGIGPVCMQVELDVHVDALDQDWRIWQVEFRVSKGTKMVGRTSWKAWWQMIGYQMFDLRANCRTLEVQSCIWSAVVHLSVLSFLWLLLFILIVKTWANQFIDVVIFERNLLKSISGEDIQWDLITLQLLYVLITRMSLLTIKKQLLLRCSPEIYETGVLSVIIQQNAKFLSELSLLQLLYLCHVEKSRPAKS
jgi:hypothetical protein